MELKTRVRDNTAKVLYDCCKISFAVLVIGVVASKSWSKTELISGMGVTVILFAAGVIIDRIEGG